MPMNDSVVRRPWGSRTWHKAQDLLSKEFNVDDDTYKGAAKEIHNLFLDDGWTPPPVVIDSPYDAQMWDAALAVVESMSTEKLSQDNKAVIAEGVLEMIKKCLDAIDEQNGAKP